MTTLDRQIMAFILKALLRAGKPMSDLAIRDAIRSGFAHVDFTSGDLGTHIAGCEEKQLISGTNDEVFGLIWDLTPKGKIKAQQL